MYFVQRALCNVLRASCNVLRAVGLKSNCILDLRALCSVLRAVFFGASCIVHCALYFVQGSWFEVEMMYVVQCTMFEAVFLLKEFNYVYNYHYGFFLKCRRCANSC